MLLTQHVLCPGGADDDLCAHGGHTDLHARVAILCQLTSQQLVQLGEEHAIGDELKGTSTAVAVLSASLTPHACSAYSSHFCASTSSNKQREAAPSTPSKPIKFFCVQSLPLKNQRRVLRHGALQHDPSKHLAELKDSSGSWKDGQHAQFKSSKGRRPLCSPSSSC
jgi:hypothetical protein